MIQRSHPHPSVTMKIRGDLAKNQTFPFLSSNSFHVMLFCVTMVSSGQSNRNLVPVLMKVIMCKSCLLKLSVYVSMGANLLTAFYILTSVGGKYDSKSCVNLICGGVRNRVQEGDNTDLAHPSANVQLRT